MTMKLYKFYKPNCAPCEKQDEMLKFNLGEKESEIIRLNIMERDNLHKLKEQGFKTVPILMFENGLSLEGHVPEINLVEFLIEGGWYGI